MHQRRAAARPYTRAAEDSPQTPSTRHHDQINAIVARIERNWHLGLTLRDKNWSPSRATTRQKVDQDKCYGPIKYLYFKASDVLDQLLKEFDANAKGTPAKDRLSYLRRLLDEGLRKAAKTGTSFTSRTPLQHKLEQVATPSHRSTARLEAAPSSIFNRPHSSAGLNDGNMPYTEGALEPTQPDTPTAAEDDERIESPPQSPSLQASLRRQELSSPSDRDTSYSRDRRSQHLGRAKRTSESSIESEHAPKCPKTSCGKKDSESTFAVPAPPLTRGNSSRRHSGATSMTTSMTTSTTSFASTTESRSDSSFSTNRDSTTTANTSFATSVYPSQSKKSQQVEEFHSSGTFGSMGTEIDWTQAEEEAIEATSFGPANSLEEFETFQSSPNVVSPSKSMEHHQIKSLPRGGLFVPETSRRLERMPFKHRWEFMRVALEVKSDPDDLLPKTHNEHWQDYSALWDYFEKHDSLRGSLKNLKRSSEKAWSAAEVVFENNTLKAFENITLKATLAFNQTNVGPLFTTQLQPLKIEDTSCRFQRAFGGDRFLYLETPAFERNQMPYHLKQQERNLAERFQEWLIFTQKSFLGRKWETIHVEALKRKKQTMRRQAFENRGYRVILFATGGCDIERKTTERIRIIHSSRRHEMTRFDLINWFMPFGLNSHQPYLKAFARIKLGFTTTDPGLVFKPSQVRYVQDIEANGELEENEYNDRQLDWPRDKIKNRVMNDGCARISVGAAQQMWKKLNKEGAIPSTFQGRIGGAKGMWMLSASPDTQDDEHRAVWIEISKSQLKFEPHLEDKDKRDKAFDPHRLAFDLHSIEMPAEQSFVYLSFFPILQDRGVEPENLKELFRKHLDQERENLLESIENPVHLRTWVNQQNALGEERNREGNMTWQAGMPQRLQEKVIRLLESGFHTSSCDYLADRTQHLVAESLRLLRQQVRVPLSRCTYIKGVADPLGVLKPGEIHVQFSKSFVDEASGECLNFLNDRAVLVARNPALRRSDIQKVRASFNLKLAHLRDVVVFPTRGSYPLAGKLQGGDYDGDTFWVCWEPELVKPFQNAPHPLEDPAPGKYSIKVDDRKLKHMHKGSSVGNFLRSSFEFGCKPSLLGPASKLHERVFYMENDLDSKRAKALADIHDLLVDSSKNGYIFEDEAYEEFKRTYIKLSEPIRKPKYEEAREKDREVKKTSARHKSVKYKRPPDFNSDSILDCLYFETIEPHTRETLAILEKRFKKAKESPDRHLEEPFLAEKRGAERCEDEDDRAICDELKRLTASLDHIRRRWGDMLHAKSKRFALAGAAAMADAFDDPDTYNAAVDECFALFKELEPVNAAGSPVISRWTRCDLMPGAPTHWELLKASALYHQSMKSKGEKSSTFAFQMAGNYLCWIKAYQTGVAHPVVDYMWSNMKPKKIKKAGFGGEGKRGREGEMRFGGSVDGAIDDDDREPGDETAYESAEEEIGGGNDW